MSHPILRVDIRLDNASTNKAIMALKEKIPREVLSAVSQMQIIENVPALSKPLRPGFYILSGDQHGAEGTVENRGIAPEDGFILKVRANGGAEDKLLTLYHQILRGEIAPNRD